MVLPKIFIASSTEGLTITNMVSNILRQKLGEKAEVMSWTRKFDLSATYIESLEKATGEHDFAILVMTPDDITTSRKKETLAPRDNVIFELGLFMGSLGRERCFILHEEKPDLKIPTDLLGIKTAVFRLNANTDLEKVLSPACDTIINRITHLGTRYKLSSEDITKQTAIRIFCEQIEGEWLQRINSPGINAIGFLQMKQDFLFNTIKVNGKSFDKKGNHTANWKSLLSRVEKDELKVLYHWQGWHTNAQSAHIPFQGITEIEFDKALKSDDLITRGTGKIWDINMSQPEKTIVKPFEFRRILDEDTTRIMNSGNEAEIKSKLTSILQNW